MNPQKPKTKIKMKDAQKYKAIYCINFLTSCRNSERIWSMNVLLQSHGENPAPKDQDTASSSHEVPMESRAKVEQGSGKHSVYTHFPKDQNCTRASCRRRAGTVVPRAEHFSD